MGNNGLKDLFHISHFAAYFFSKSKDCYVCDQRVASSNPGPDRTVLVIEWVQLCYIQLKTAAQCVTARRPP